MNLKNLIIALSVLTLFSCSENKTTKNESQLKEHVITLEPKGDTSSEVKSQNEEKNYTLDNFHAEYYSTPDTILEDDIVQIAYTKKGLFIVLTNLFETGKLLLLVDEHRNILDFEAFSNQSGDEYAEDIYVELFPKDLVSYIKEARDYVVENPKVMETKSIYYADFDELIEEPYRKIKDNIGDKIETIRYYFKTINDCISAHDCKKYLYTDTVENKEYTCQNCKLFFSRLDSKWKDESFSYVSNYYLIGGKLFFVFKQKFDENSGTGILQDENRYYFYNDILIRIIQGKEKETLSESEMRNQEKFIMEEKNSIEKTYYELKKQKSVQLKP